MKQVSKVWFRLSVLNPSYVTTLRSARVNVPSASMVLRHSSHCAGDTKYIATSKFPYFKTEKCHGDTTCLDYNENGMECGVLHEAEYEPSRLVETCHGGDVVTAQKRANKVDAKRSLFADYRVVTKCPASDPCFFHRGDTPASNDGIRVYPAPLAPSGSDGIRVHAGAGTGRGYRCEPKDSPARQRTELHNEPDRPPSAGPSTAPPGPPLSTPPSPPTLSDTLPPYSLVDPNVGKSGGEGKSGGA